jgi:hypothetical protein
MRRRIGTLGVVAALLAVLGLLAAQTIASADVRVRKARLSGANEIPAADPDGTGMAKVRINDDAGTVCFNISWKDIESPTMSHIHDGDATENGPIVVTLFDNAFASPNDHPLPDTIHAVSGCAVDQDPALLDDIQNNPRDFYVNVHNQEFGGGAIRGQLKK